MISFFAQFQGTTLFSGQDLENAGSILSLLYFYFSFLLGLYYFIRFHSYIIQKVPLEVARIVV